MMKRILSAVDLCLPEQGHALDQDHVPGQDLGVAQGLTHLLLQAYLDFYPGKLKRPLCPPQVPNIMLKLQNKADVS